jgi:enamine deaminase RidA (YjgF/YER057c/UK114 family)
MSRRVMTAGTLRTVTPDSNKVKHLWSHASISDAFVLVSGQPGLDDEGNSVGEEAAQSRRALERVRMVLEAGGSSLQDVLSFRIFADSEETFRAAERVLAGEQPWRPAGSPEPAISGFIADQPIGGALLEIDAFAPVSGYGEPGSGPTDATGLIFFSGLAAQEEDLTRQLDALNSALRSRALTPRNLAKVTWYARDREVLRHAFRVWNDFSARHFPEGDFPAVTWVVVELPDGAAACIESIAMAGDRSTVALALPPGTETPPGTSEAVRIGDWIFPRGQSVAGAEGAARLADLPEQTAWALESTDQAIRAAGGAGLGDVVHATTWFSDASRYDELNVVRRTYYLKHFAEDSYPAGTAAVGGGPAEGDLINLDFIAYVEPTAKI